MTRNPNKYRLMAGTAILLGFFSCLCRAQPPQPQYGPWMPLRDGAQNGVQIAFKLYPDGTQYFKLQNTYKVPVTFTCQFSFITKNAKRQTDSGCGATNLAPGAQVTNGGMVDMGVLNVDSSSLTAKVKFPLAPPDSSSALSTTSSGIDRDVHPASLSVCVVGEPLVGGFSDGEHKFTDSPIYAKEDSTACPTRGKNYYVYSIEVDWDVTTKKGIATACNSKATEHFIRCDSRANTMQYKSGPEVPLHPSATGVRD